MKEKKRYLIKDVARVLGVTRRSIYNWEKAGKIPRVERDTMSNYRIYTEEDLRKLKKITGRSYL